MREANHGICFTLFGGWEKLKWLWEFFLFLLPSSIAVIVYRRPAQPSADHHTHLKIELLLACQWKKEVRQHIYAWCKQI